MIDDSARNVLLDKYSTKASNPSPAPWLQLDTMTINRAITSGELGPVPCPRAAWHRVTCSRPTSSSRGASTLPPPNATRELFCSCHPFPYGFSVDRVSRSRSIEWRNARDTPAPEITPATRTDGSIVGLRA